MFRIDNDTAAVALPTPAAVGPNPDGYFTDGNPGSAIPATVVDADWANAVQEEISYVIEQAGDTLDKADNTQLKAAIDTMITAAVAPAATETVAGIAELATQAETNAGTDDERIVTPLKLRFGFSISLTATGHIKFPAWAGGLIINWGETTAQTTDFTETVTFNQAFGTAMLAAFATPNSNTSYSSGNQIAAYAKGLSLTQMEVTCDAGTALASRSAYWLAIGY